MELFVAVVMIVFTYVMCKLPEWKFDNRTTPPGTTTDFGKMNDDLMRNGMSKRDVMNKFNRGGYDILDKWYKGK